MGDAVIMYKSYFVMLMLLFLSACELQNLRPTGSKDVADILETEKRAQTAYVNEDWATAEKEYKYLTQQVPKEAEPWFRLGNIYARTDRLEQAIQMYRAALLRDPDNGKILHNLGVVQLRQATGTFIQMVDLTDAGDPLNTRGKHVINAVTELLSTGFE